MLQWFTDWFEPLLDSVHMRITFNRPMQREAKGSIRVESNSNFTVENTVENTQVRLIVL